MVDTNVLVYAHLESSEFHPVSRALLEAGDASEYRLAVTPQILIEFYAVITNPRRVETVYQPSEGVQAIDRLVAGRALILLPQPVDVVDRWAELVSRWPVSGNQIFDYQIVATMLANRVTTIYTFNRGDFERFPPLSVLTPN